MNTTNYGGLKRVNLIGQRFGMLVVIKKMPSNKIATRFICKCDCGNEAIIIGTELKRGNNKSCGCNRTPRKTYEYRNHPLYDVWKGMKARCYNPKHGSYFWYGARGVKVCEEWRIDFISFYNWAIKNGWEEGLQLDKDIKGSGLLYSPSTCCFVTVSINSQNRTNTKLTEESVNSIRVSNKTNKELSILHNVHISTIYKIKRNKKWVQK